MNYEFHVGDYVETWSGAVGYIISIEDDAFTWVNHTPIRDGDDAYFNVEQRNFYSSVRDLFARVGAYDFTKKEKKKIARLSEDDSWLTFRNTNKANVNLCYIIKRINELIDAVNLLLDKSTES